MKQINFIIAKTINLAILYGERQEGWKRTDTQMFEDTEGILTVALCSAGQMRGSSGGIAYLFPRWAERTDAAKVNEMIHDRTLTRVHLGNDQHLLGS